MSPCVYPLTQRSMLLSSVIIFTLWWCSWLSRILIRWVAWLSKSTAALHTNWRSIAKSKFFEPLSFEHNRRSALVVIARLLVNLHIPDFLKCYVRCLLISSNPWSFVCIVCPVEVSQTFAETKRATLPRFLLEKWLSISAISIFSFLPLSTAFCRSPYYSVLSCIIRAKYAVLLLYFFISKARKPWFYCIS